MVVWAIGSADPFEQLVSFQDQMGLTYPILYDPGQQVLSQYEQQTAFSNTIFPQDWVVGVDGRIAYVNNGYEPDEMIAVIESELAK